MIDGACDEYVAIACYWGRGLLGLEKPSRPRV
jgi:hypothetical protein